MERWPGLLLLALASLMIAACSDESGGGADAGDTGGDGNDSTVMVSGAIAEDTTWTPDKTYVLTELIYVENGATLTIEAGTTILGNNGSALVITQSGRIDAQGTAAQPIVLTSSRPDGSRRRGDWGGIVLLGEATINVPGGTNQIEGISPEESRGSYGGDDDTHDCGSLVYVRIEFAGFTFGIDNELNGLTVGGCGSDTELDYIQVHMGDDDGIEFFGGTASISHAFITRAADDSLDFDQGWRGAGQFIAIVQEGAEGDNGYEADNNEDNNDATPRTAPELFNVTLIGSADTAASQRAMVMRRGLAGQYFNTIMQGQPKESIDIRDTATVAQIDSGDHVYGSLIFYDIGPDGQTYFEEEVCGTDDDDDGCFIEADFFTCSGTQAPPEMCADATSFDVDPELGDTAPYFDSANPEVVPNLVPAADSIAGDSELWVVPNDNGFFDTDATYVGAFEPGGENWLDGWTAMPAD